MGRDRFFVGRLAFVGRFFVGRWVAMVLTSSSCNLGIDNFDSRQVPICSHMFSPSFNSKFGFFEISKFLLDLLFIFFLILSDYVLELRWNLETKKRLLYYSSERSPPDAPILDCITKTATRWINFWILDIILLDWIICNNIECGLDFIIGLFSFLIFYFILFDITNLIFIKGFFFVGR